MRSARNVNDSVVELSSLASRLAGEACCMYVCMHIKAGGYIE